MDLGNIKFSITPHIPAGTTQGATRPDSLIPALGHNQKNM